MRRDMYIDFWPENLKGTELSWNDPGIHYFQLEFPNQQNKNHTMKLMPLMMEVETSFCLYHYQFMNMERQSLQC
jgi:hypothetical protein